MVTNERGEIQITNRELNRLFGYQMGELLGRNVSGARRALCVPLIMLCMDNLRCQ